MKILLISYDDWANFGHDMANALRSVGLNCTDLKRKPHSFGYDSEAKIAGHEEILKAIRENDIIIFMHSWSEYLRYAKTLNKRCFVFHTGTAYRVNPIQCNETFNEFVEATFTDQCEFMELGAKNIHYVATAINTDKIKPLPWETKDKLTIAHYPSNSNVKGTGEILRMLDEVNGERELFYLNHDTKTIPHREQIKRMSWCDVYIELFKPTLYGKPYGCFGVTAFEAAALGKIVITNNIHEKVYADSYGSCALWIANTEMDFKKKINHLINADEFEVSGYGEMCRDWIVQKHSYKATGEYVKKLLNL